MSISQIARCVFIKKTIPRWQLGGFVFTAVMGTLLHFLFDWTGGNMATAVVSAVNESIWEHLKLLYYPMLAAAVVEYFFWGRGTDSFWCIKLLGSLAGLIIIPTIYYTYTGALGVKADWFNITIFFLAAGIAYWVETKLLQNDFACRIQRNVSIVLLCLIAVIFTVFTFIPPSIPLFQDPLTGTYGFQIQQ